MGGVKAVAGPLRQRCACGDSADPCLPRRGVERLGAPICLQAKHAVALLSVIHGLVLRTRNLLHFKD